MSVLYFRSFSLLCPVASKTLSPCRHEACVSAILACDSQRCSTLCGFELEEDAAGERDGWTWKRLRRRGDCRIDKESRWVEDGGISQDSYICQSRVGTGGRWMRGWKGDWGMRAAGFIIALSVRPNVRFRPARPPADWEGPPTNREAVTTYRFLTMLEILSTEGRLGHN